MNGWSLWFSCRKIYRSSHGLLGFHFWDKPTPTTRVTSLPPNVNKLQGTNCSCWMSIASGGWIADIFVLHLGGQRRWHLVESRFGLVFSKRWKPAFNAFSMLVAKIQQKLGGIEATIVWMFFWETLILKKEACTKLGTIIEDLKYVVVVISVYQYISWPVLKWRKWNICGYNHGTSGKNTGNICDNSNLLISLPGLSRASSDMAFLKT